MPALLQLPGLDRPGLPTLDAAKAAALTALLEPLCAPFELRGIGWVIHNLQMSLTEFGRQPGGTGNARLNAITEAVVQAATWLPRPSSQPEVVVGDTIGLWACLLALDPSQADPKLLKATGSIYFLLKTGSASPSGDTLKVLLEACLSTRGGVREVRDAQTTAALIACSSALIKAQVQLQTRALARRSAASDMLEARVEKQMAGAYRFDVRDRIEDMTVCRGLTPTDVVETAKQIREGAESGSGRLLTVAMAHWLGVMPADMVAMRIFASTPGLIRLDASSSYAVIDLGGVLTELALAPLSGALAASDLVYLPLPAWISRLIRALRNGASQAESLKDLPGLSFSANDLRRLFSEIKVPRRITPGKFVSDRALPLIDGAHDSIRLAVATLDFSRVHKVALAYERLCPTEHLASLTLRAELVGWGELAVARVPNHGYLSKVTPDVESIKSIADALRKAVEDLSPGPNAGVERLLHHHQAFVRYVAFMLAATLLLRGQETTVVPATVLGLRGLPGFNDKRLPGATTKTPEVIFGPTLRHQLRYLKAHYDALILRLEQRATSKQPWITEAVSVMRKVAEGAHDLPLLVTVVDGVARAYTHLDLVSDLRGAWVGKADAIRHASSDVLRTARFSYGSREAARRHVGGSRPISSKTSAWSREDWQHEGAKMQEAVMAAFGLTAIGGLIKSLPSHA